MVTVYSMVILSCSFTEKLLISRNKHSDRRVKSDLVFMIMFFIGGTINQALKVSKRRITYSMNLLLFKLYLSPETLVKIVSSLLISSDSRDTKTD